jgi:hypothetical protein
MPKMKRASRPENSNRGPLKPLSLAQEIYLESPASLSDWDRGYDDGYAGRRCESNPSDAYEQGYLAGFEGDTYKDYMTTRVAPPAPYSTETGDPSVFEQKEEF